MHRRAEALHAALARCGTGLCGLRLQCGALLDGVGQLVGDQLAATRALRLKLIPTKEDVLTDRERVRVEIGALLRSGLAGMNADVAEVRAEARFHLVANRGWQR